MDYSSVRLSSSHESTVSVNHRALITRALTKYPVDYALFRELLQNSADARATSATIQFSTSSTDMNPAKIHTVPINRLTFMNNGMDFDDSDWKRLKEIASGNPNESKIGAFGVGFYSVFELTDEPLVHSGAKIVNFKYKGVQLHYYENNARKYQKGTLIDLPYRHPGNLGDVGSFSGFLIQNFLLINLNEINLEIIYGNGTKKTVLHLKKSPGEQVPMKTPSTFEGVDSNFFTLRKVKMTKFTVECKYMNSALFSRAPKNTPENVHENKKFSCELSRVDASIAVSLEKDFRDKISESLLKPPPKATTISMLSISETNDVSIMDDSLRHYIFPEDASDAKIFIGFTTNQSTGFRSHLALQSAIPTMERTALDLSHYYVKEWNIELLKMAGAVTRFAYENELMLIKSAKNIKSTEQAKQAKHVCSKFKFQASAPDKTIGEYIKSGFFTSANQTLVPSTQGILLNTYVRYANEKMVALLRKTPVIDDIELADYFRDCFNIETIKPADIASDICSSPLSVPRAKLYVEWLEKHWKDIADDDRLKLKDISIHDNSRELITFKSVLFYIDQSVLNISTIISSLPRCCIPASIAQELGHQNLRNIFGFKPLQPINFIRMWVNGLNKSLNSTNTSHLSERFANEILDITSISWPKMIPETRNHLVQLLSTSRCIPTENMGMRYPQESYIEPIKGFINIPVATKKFSPDLLEQIGVRRSLNMNDVLSNLMSGKLTWSNEDLINYLQTNQKNLKESDWKLLKETSFFRGTGLKGLIKASDLYAPDSILAQLGMPTLELDGWNANSPEAKLMYALGLMRFPTESVLIKQGVATKQPNIAVDYFIQHFRDANYNSANVRSIVFLPTMKDGILAAPSNCYTDGEVGLFDEMILNPDYEYAANTLGVAKSPSISQLLHKTIGAPQKYLSNVQRRNDIFAFFARRVGELTSTDIHVFKERKIIPAADPYTGKTVWYRPNEVFLPYRGNEPDADIIRPILPTYIATKRTLALFCCLEVSELPDAYQLASIIVDNPVAAFKKLNNCDIYEQVLSWIGKRWNSCISDYPSLVTKMKMSQFLLGEKVVGATDSEKETSLYFPSELAIVDDSIIYDQFRNVVITAPQDDKIELLYRMLNVPTLSSLLKEDYSADTEIKDPEACSALKDRIQERLKLFISYTKSPLLIRNPNVRVRLVRGITLRRQLPPHPTISMSTSCYWNKKEDELLVVPEKIDWLDVANALSKKFLEKPNQDAVVVLELQLSAALKTLARKGYNIVKLSRRKPGQVSLENLLNRSEQLTPASETETMQNAEVNTSNWFIPSWAKNWWYGSNSSGNEGGNISVDIGAPPSGTAGGVKRKRFQEQQIQGFDDILSYGKSKLRKYNHQVLNCEDYTDKPTDLVPQMDESCGSGNKHELVYKFTLENGVKVYKDDQNTQPLQDEEELGRYSFG